MKKSSIIICLLLAVLLALSVVPAAFGAVVFSGEEENLSGAYDSTVFHAGSDPVSTADIEGILFLAGKTARAAGSSEYAFLAGNTVTIDGDCIRDVFAGGYSVSLSGTVGRDLYAAANELNLQGKVGRDVFAAARLIRISGEISGNVFLSAEEIQIADDAKIDGLLRYNSKAKISAPAEILSGAEQYEEKEEESTSVQITAEPEKSPSVLKGLTSKAFGYIGLLLIAYFFLWLTPMWEKVDSVRAGKGFGFYAATFGIGFAVLALLPIAAILLMITGIGLRPAFVLLLICIAVIIAAPVFLGFYLGALLWRSVFKKVPNYWAELAIGLLVWRILSMIPGVNIATMIITGPLALGVLTRMLGKKRSTQLTV